MSIGQLRLGCVAMLGACLLLREPGVCAESDATSPAGTTTAQPSLDEIRARLREQLTSIRSIWCEYRVRSAADYGEDPADWPLYLWAQQDDKILHRVFPHQPSSMDGKWLEEWQSYDGKAGYHVIFDEYEAGAPYIVHRWSFEPRDLNTRLVPANHLGLVIRGSTSTLAQLIQGPDVRFEAPIPVRVSGHDCWLLDLGPYDLSGTFENHLRVFLDAQLDYLPRQIESIPKRIVDPALRPGAEDYRVQPGEEMWQIGIEDFMQVEDQAFQTKRWFPRRMLHSMQMTAVVETVRLNEPIPDEEFVPAMPAGTLLIDNPDSPQSRRTIVGGAEGQMIHAERVNRRRTFPEPTPMTTAVSDPVIARPLRSNIALWTVVIGLTLLAGATFAALRNRLMQRN
jgi:hypothetical protein